MDEWKPVETSQLNYHHLRYFWEVARQGSLRLAAEKLNVSQPTISAQIKSLEESLNQQLFSRAGRGLKLTAAGRLVMDYASEIFGLGGRLMEALGNTQSTPTSRLNIGFTDAYAKLLAWNLVRPALAENHDLYLSCAEGNAADLLTQMVLGRIDLVLSDEPASASLPIKAYNHLLGEASVVFGASAALAEKLREDFPHSLNGSRMLLPSIQTAWRHQLDHWFEVNDVRPVVVAEFADSALMKTAAADGLGVVPIAKPVIQEAKTRYGLHWIGDAVGCAFPSYIITVERSLKHPAVQTIAKAARSLFQVPVASAVNSNNSKAAHDLTQPGSAPFETIIG